METTAVYWESRIKTYGLNKLNNVFLFELYCPDEKMDELGDVLSSTDFQKIRTKFLILQKIKDGLSLVVCVSESEGRGFRASLKNEQLLNSYKYLYPVGIIFFYGPHFGDRYGIASAAFSLLLEVNVEIIASGCSSASVYLVVAEKDLDRAERILAKAFDSAN
jgi:aspartokinase